MFKRQVLVGMLVALLATTASAVMDFEGYASDAEWKAAGMDGWVMDPYSTHSNFIELRTDTYDFNVMRLYRGTTEWNIRIENDLGTNLATALVGGSISYRVYEQSHPTSGRAIEIMLSSGGSEVARVQANISPWTRTAYAVAGDGSTIDTGAYQGDIWNLVRFEFAADGYNMYANDVDVFGQKIAYHAGVDVSAGVDTIEFTTFGDFLWESHFDYFEVVPPAGTVIYVR